MRKVLLIIAGCVIMLSGCLNSVAVKVVDDMYTNAIMEESETVEFYFSDEYFSQYPLDSLIEELASHMRHAGGVTLLNTIELTRNQLDENIVHELDEKYDEKWHFVVNDADDEHVMTWIVVKTSTQYEIVEGNKVTIKDYQDQIKK